MRGGKGIFAAVCCVAVLLGAGCGAQQHRDTADTGGNDTSWAQTIRRSAASAKTDLAKNILKDGTITAEEFNEFVAAYDACLKKNGMTVSFDGDGANENVTDATGQLSKEQGDAIIQQCQTQTDYMLIVPVYQQMKANPEHKDPAQLVVDCLKKKGLVDQSMTRQDYIDTVTDEQRNTQTFGRYEDPQNPQYDSQKAQEYLSCQASYH